MNISLHGTVHGKTIQPDQDLGVPEGKKAEVTIMMIPSKKSWGEGIRRTVGALADDPDWDGIMDEIHQARKIDRRPQSEEKCLPASR